MKQFVLLLLLFCVKMNAADLPKNGIDPPPAIGGPFDHPDNPEVPQPNGLALVVVFGALYVLKKHRKH